VSDPTPLVLPDSHDHDTTTNQYNKTEYQFNQIEFQSTNKISTIRDCRLTPRKRLTLKITASN